MDRGWTKHGDFGKAEKAFESLKSDNFVPGNFESFESFELWVRERRWEPPSSGKGRGAKHCASEFCVIYLRP